MDLNSTVILLICRTKTRAWKFRKFKFHCDSINIKWLDNYESKLNKFKFHCDSINIRKNKHH